MDDIQNQWPFFCERLNESLLWGIYPESNRLSAAMHYSLSLKGKRLRPLLFLTTIDALRGDPIRFIDVAACLEIIHTYSLIHDDLPCMDNDELRRGMPTVHCQFDEATALLAGDTLLTWAFERLAWATNLDADQVMALIRLITHAIGVEGMAGGQGMDLAFCGQADEIPRIHRLKTAELIRASMAAAAIVCRCDDIIPVLSRSAIDIGLAFQLADDLLDVTGDPALVGKKLHKDEENMSPNAALYKGIDQVIMEIDILHSRALEALNEIGIATTALKALYKMMAHRMA